MTTPDLSLAAPPTQPQPSFRLPWWDRIPIMDRYILREMLGPFLFGVGAFTSVGLSIGVVFELVRQVTEAGLPLAVAGQVFLLKMPDFLVLAFPMSMLLSALMAYNRLSSDSELIALRSCGISSYRFILPGILMSIVVTGITFAFYESVVPAANFQAQVTLQTALNQSRPQLEEKNNIVYQQFDRQTSELARIFYARRYDGEQMRGLTILDFTRGELSQIVSAETGIWHPEDQLWEFRDGTIYGVAPDGSYSGIATFKSQEFTIPETPLSIASQSRDETQMNATQIWQYLRVLRQTNNTADIRKWEVRLQQKLALPFVCIAFGLIGASLGTAPNQRTGRATGFGISVLIIFSYYLLAFVTGALGINGTLPTILAGWFPWLLGMGVGIYLLRQTAR